MTSIGGRRGGSGPSAPVCRFIDSPIGQELDARAICPFTHRRRRVSRVWFTWFVVFGALAASSGAQEFDVGNYRAAALIGEPRLIQGISYVSFAGDTGFRAETPWDSAALTRHLKAETDLLSHFDLNVVNQEFGLIGFSSGQTLAARSDDMMIGALRDSYRLVSVANNHALDFGSAGVHYNVRTLRAARFELIGLRESPVFLWERGGRVIALYALTAYTDKPDRDALVLTMSHDDLALVRRLTATAAFRIAFVHLGSMSSYPSPHERAEVSRVIDQGADLVICTGSHFVKGFLRERGRPVIYGLGDHLFSYASSGTEPVGMYAVAGFGPQGLIQLFVIPFWNAIGVGRVGPLEGSAFRTFAQRLRERSTGDTARYYSDPRSLAVLRERFEDLRLADFRKLSARQAVYALRILMHHYWLYALSAGIVAAVGAVLVGRRARRKRQPTIDP